MNETTTLLLAFTVAISAGGGIHRMTLWSFPLRGRRVAGVSYAVGREANSVYTETLNGIQTANSGGNQLPSGIDPYVTAGQPASGLLPGVNANAGGADGADGAGDQRLQAYTFRICLTDVPATEELSATPGAVTVFRESIGASDLAVQVNFTGSATAGTDYKSLPAIITIPAGSLAASVLVQAFPDSIIEGSETVIASLAANAAYAIASLGNATVTIYDPPFDRWKAANFTRGTHQPGPLRRRRRPRHRRPRQLPRICPHQRSAPRRRARSAPARVAGRHGTAPLLRAAVIFPRAKRVDADRRQCGTL